MKKIILTAAFAVIGIASLSAQSFGAKAGYTNASAKVKFAGVSDTNSESGFFIGAFVEIEATESIIVKPELLYTIIDDNSSLQLPILGKFAIGEGGFNVQAGPQVNFSLEETGDDFSAVSVGLTGGLGYDINEKFVVEAHYNLQLTNSYTGNADDFSVRSNLLNIGVGYKFN